MSTNSPAASGEKAAAKKQSKPAAKPAEYTVEELAQAGAKVFGDVSRDCITAALRLAGKTTATPEEAKAIVREFANKEVK